MFYESHYDTNYDTSKGDALVIEHGDVLDSNESQPVRTNKLSI